MATLTERVASLEKWKSAHLVGHVLSGHTHPGDATDQDVGALDTRLDALENAADPAPVVTPPPVVPPAPTGSVLTLDVATQRAQFLTAVANMNYDTILIPANHPNWGRAIEPNVDRTARPLTILPVPGQTVVFAPPDASLNDGCFYFRNAKHITMAGFIFDGWHLAYAGVVWLGNTDYMTLNRITVRNSVSAGGDYESIRRWALYVSYDGGVQSDHVVANDWNVSCPDKSISALQAGQPAGSCHIEARRWTVDNCAYAIYAYNHIDELFVSDWNITNTTRAARGKSIFFGADVKGSYSNMVLTTSGGLESQGGMTNGGGNSGL